MKLISSRPMSVAESGLAFQCGNEEVLHCLKEHPRGDERVTALDIKTALNRKSGFFRSGMQFRVQLISSSAVT